MSVKALTWAWAQDLPMGTKGVLMALADHADDDGVCWPGMRGIAAKCGYSVRNTQRHVARLSRRHLLSVLERTRPDGSHTSNIFVLNTSPEHAQTVTRVVTELSGGGDISVTRVVTSVSPGGDASVTPRTVIEPSLEEPSPNGVAEEQPPNGNFRDTLKELVQAKNRQAVLFKVVQKKFADYEWDGAPPSGQIGRLGRLLKQHGIEPTLRALWVAESQKPVGDPISLMQAILQKRQKGSTWRVEAGRHPEDQGGGW